MVCVCFGKGRLNIHHGKIDCCTLCMLKPCFDFVFAGQMLQTKDEVKGDKGSVSLENHTTWHLDAKKSAW